LKSPHLLAAALAALAGAAFATTEVEVDLKTAVGPVKIMNAVNNGPSKPSVYGQPRGNFDSYRAARIPFARTHDANFCSAYGAPHTVGVTALFPNFEADENDPKSYDFACTDAYLGTMIEAGTEPFFRLGQTIEHDPVKYGILPPKDFAKWARVCEHVIRHYTEGWANGKKWKIRYWEIWNEPDNQADDAPLASKETWGGTEAQFNEFFCITLKHLKKCFPHLKIGGPAFSWDEAYWKRCLQYQHEHGAPIDFVSWHAYARNTDQMLKRAARVRKMMDEAGYAKAESILNEWNYLRDFGKSWIYSLEAESGRFNLKSAAFVAAAMTEVNRSSVDLLMYYDARLGTAMNCMFDIRTYQPLKGYYPFYAWAKLRDLGTEVRTTVTDDESKAASSAFLPGQVYAICAQSADGKRKGLLVTRFNDDGNVVDKRSVTLRVKGRAFAEPLFAYLTDETHTYTEVPLVVNADGSATLALDPNAFAYVPFETANLAAGTGEIAEAFKDCVFHGKTDKPNPTAYKTGEPIVFTLWFEKVGALPAGAKYTVFWERTGDDGKTESGRVPFDPKGTVTVKTALDRPGFVRLLAHVQDADGRNVRRAAPPPGDLWGSAEKAVFFDGGAGVDTAKLKPGVEEPADFDAFWARQRARLAAVPVKAVRREVPGAADAKARVYEVRVDCAGPRPVTGYLTIPKTSGRYRAHVTYQGYGTGYPAAPTDGPANEILFNVNAHGYELGRDKAYYDAFFEGIRTEKYTYAFSPVQNDTPEGAYFCGLALRVMRSLEYVKTLPEWNGEKLIVQGGSQGGLQTTWAAALDKDVNRAYCGITWCCDLGGFKAGRLQAPWHIPWTDSLRYFDAVFHARRVKCRFSIERAGLGDYTCPPSGLAIQYNELAGEKSVNWVQGSRHGFIPPGENQSFEIKTY